MYCFSDYDENTQREFSIDGEDYRALMALCFRYAVAFSLTFSSDEIEKHLPKTLKTEQKKRSLAKKGYRRRCTYVLNDSAKEFLLSRVQDLFAWIAHDGRNNPEDLTFYREDGSVFFWSETHEGNCALYNRPAEEVSAVTNTAGWVFCQDGQSLPYGFLPPELLNSGKDDSCEA